MIINSLILIAYFVIYGFLHSLLANLIIKKKTQTTIGSTWMRAYRMGYNIFAILTILPFFALQGLLQPNPKLYSIPSPWHWLTVGGQLLAVLGAGITVLQTGLPHFLGLSQLFEKTEQVTENTPFNISGFYGWVRHPLYFFSLLFIWLSPVMYLNQLIGYLMFSLYFYVGSMYEEEKLVAEFGDTYRSYQQRVPRLIPWRSNYS